MVQPPLNMATDLMHL
uniref:Uncharacterized protein n=1 Tax=Anguilla anguilla TaxID=7936 RepID=A0A0E9XBZ7_ANGAN